ncbi:MAG: dihydroxyacetone kinase subunit L [Burkholderiales bacterium]|nr:dihydroxyacetone kinase subunit L [Burkholderiales bacterium]
MLTSAAIVEGLARMHVRSDAIRDALNAVDRTLGDGDTGMTVAAIVRACHDVAAELPPDIGVALLELGRATSRSSGSSLAAVLAIGLSAAGRSVRGKSSANRGEMRAMLAQASQVIIERSGATPGDKTVLDSLLRIEQGLDTRTPDEGMLATTLSAARAALDEFRSRESRLGRAHLYGARSVGLDDPGMKAVVLLLEAAASEA